MSFGGASKVGLLSGVLLFEENFLNSFGVGIVVGGERGRKQDGEVQGTHWDIYNIAVTFVGA